MDISTTQFLLEAQGTPWEKGRKIAKDRGPCCLWRETCSVSDRKAAFMESQHSDCLNKTCTVRTAVDRRL